MLNLMLGAGIIAKHVCDSKLLLKFCQFPLVRVKISDFSLKVGPKELNHAAIGHLKSGRRGVKRGS